MDAASATAERALRAAVESSCSVRFAREVGTAVLASEIEHWLDPTVPPDELDPLVLARLVAHEVRWVGKHFLPGETLERLAVVRERHHGRDAHLDAFLDCLLDKRDGCFWNRTYLFLPVLEVLLAEHDLLPSGVAALLAADIVRHELCAAHRGADVGTLGRPDPRTLRTRLRHSLRFMTAHLGGPESEGLLAAIAHQPEADLTALLLHLPAPQAADAGEWLELTVQPVSTVHDEYFFVRVLQAHEMSFTGMSRRMRDATAAVRGGQLDEAARLLEEAVTFMDRNASLFRIVATMRPEAFHTFRELTDGASAIQSEQYKRFEGLCGTPPPGRLGSPAFDSVPRVAAEVVDGQDTMTDAYAEARAAGGPAAGLDVVAGLLQGLEASHRRWKGTHVTLATRMLGDARGSGYTSGVGYLSEWVDHRLFWRLPDLAVSPSSPASRS
ncbi:MAG TPA: hypothetical protein VNS55_08035 [Nocardioides sp.]|nr:hypothetical protein [Nocardioides sp.]